MRKKRSMLLIEGIGRCKVESAIVSSVSYRVAGMPKMPKSVARILSQMYHQGWLRARWISRGQPRLVLAPGLDLDTVIDAYISLETVEFDRRVVEIHFG